MMLKRIIMVLSTYQYYNNSKIKIISIFIIHEKTSNMYIIILIMKMICCFLKKYGKVMDIIIGKASKIVASKIKYGSKIIFYHFYYYYSYYYHSYYYYYYSYLYYYYHLSILLIYVDN